MVLCKRKPVIFAPLPELSHPSLSTLLPPAVKTEVEAEVSDVKPGKGKGKKAVIQGPSEEEKERDLIQALAGAPSSVLNGPSKGPNKQIECWYIPQTGEVFLDYEWVASASETLTAGPTPNASTSIVSLYSSVKVSRVWHN